MNHSAPEKCKGQKVDSAKELDYANPVNGTEKEGTGTENYDEQF